MKFLRNIVFLFVMANLFLPADASSAKISPGAKSCFSTLKICLSACWPRCARSNRPLPSITPTQRGAPPSAPLSILLTPPGATESISLARPITYFRKMTKNAHNRQEIIFGYARDNEVIAYICGEVIDADRGHIGDLYIHPDCHGHGYFKDLVKTMCKLFLKQGCTFVTTTLTCPSTGSEVQWSRELAYLIRRYQRLHFNIQTFVPMVQGAVLLPASSRIIPDDRRCITMMRYLRQPSAVDRKGKEEKKD